MTDIQPDNSQPQPIPVFSTEATPSPAAPPVRQSRRNLFIIIGALIASLCLCSVLCVALLGTGAFKALSERGNVEQAVDEFMQAMAEKDTDTAYALFSARAQRQTNLSDLEKLLEGNNYVLFDGYQSATVETINLSAAFNTNPDLPQGTVANVTGTIAYTDGFTGRFEAVLEQAGDEWRLFNINITVPPDKFSP